MNNSCDNVCIRCGKPRVAKRTWKEHLNGMVLIHTSTVCPDKACQKIVDEQFAIQKRQKEAVEEARTQRSIASKLANQGKTHRKKEK